MDQCLYCGYNGLEEEQSEGENIFTSYSCSVCGWSKSVIEHIPTTEEVEIAVELLKLTWWRVVDAEGENLTMWDFERREDAERMQEQLGMGEVQEWTMKATGETPVPYYLECPHCERSVPGPDHGELLSCGHCGCEEESYEDSHDTLRR